MMKCTLTFTNKKINHLNIVFNSKIISRPYCI